MKAMILAAGLGTRLRPLTEDRPKALVPFQGKTLLERILRNLASSGVDQIVVNVHHFAPRIIEFIERIEIPGISMHVSDESKQLMDTGGALLLARHHFHREEFFLVHNVDVLTNLDIPSLIRAHRESDALATLAVKKRPTSRSLLFDGEGRLAGWRHNVSGEERLVRRIPGTAEDFGNSCIQVISGEFLDYFAETEPRNLTDMYLDLAAGHSIRPFVHNQDYWYDLGRYENYQIADKEVFLD